jgi:hypothetical protein
MDKEKILKITGDLPQIIGVCPNAFSRWYLRFSPNFSIVCFKWRGETDDIAKDMDVFCVES